MNYQNADLEITAIDEGYQVQISSPMGSAVSEFKLPFSDLEIENFILKMSGGRGQMRRVDSPQLAAARNFGRLLFDALVDESTYARFSSSIDQGRLSGNGLCVRIRTQLAPELGTLPWEYLYDSRNDTFLALSISTPVVRFVKLSQPGLPFAADYPLRILGIVSSPSDMPQLDVDAERQRIDEAIGGVSAKGHHEAVEVHWLPTATLSSLQTALRRQQFHLLHFIGHGTYDPNMDEGALVFEDGYGKSRLVSASVLGTLLRDHPSLRLATLNACEGARTGREDPFAGVAPALLRAGLPAAVAMQFEISDSAAQIFAREFYGAIADRYTVHAAVAEARKAIFASGNEIEWGIPVLFSRIENGVIFELPDIAHAPTADRGSVPPNGSAEETSAAEVLHAESSAQPTPNELGLANPQPEAQAPVQARDKFWRWLWLLAGVAIVLLAYFVFGQNIRLPISTPTTPGTPTPLLTAVQSPAPTNTQVAVAPAMETLPAADTSAANAEQEIAWSNPKDGADYIRIPAGEFLMGSMGNDVDAEPDEMPQHLVYVDEFLIMQTEVTNSQYRSCYEMDICDEPTNADWLDPQFATMPVTGVTWRQANIYAQWSAGGRLPTEAEWEKACRGTDGKIYPWGNFPPSEDRLNFHGAIGGTTKVGSYPAGAYGLYDMAGNVSEWTSDWFDENYYDRDLDWRDPANDQPSEQRSLRGGSWVNDGGLGRCADRYGAPPTFADGSVGFRVVLDSAP